MTSLQPVVAGLTIPTKIIANGNKLIKGLEKKIQKAQKKQPGRVKKIEDLLLKVEATLEDVDHNTGHKEKQNGCLMAFVECCCVCVKRKKKRPKLLQESQNYGFLLLPSSTAALFAVYQMKHREVGFVQKYITDALLQSSVEIAPPIEGISWFNSVYFYPWTAARC